MKTLKGLFRRARKFFSSRAGFWTLALLALWVGASFLSPHIFTDSFFYADEGKPDEFWRRCTYYAAGGFLFAFVAFFILIMSFVIRSHPPDLTRAERRAEKAAAARLKLEGEEKKLATLLTSVPTDLEDLAVLWGANPLAATILVSEALEKLEKQSSGRKGKR